MRERAVKVLDRGFVRLVEFMGADPGVVDAARVSYGSKSKGAAKDAGLIRYLLEHDHGTPFEHAVFKFHVKLPLFVARQWIRHRTSSYNEASMRYKKAVEEFYSPKKWRAQDVKNKQGSVAAPKLDHAKQTARLKRVCRAAMREYDAMVADGVAREMARMVLPVNLYTEWYWTVNARALMHFIGLRSEAHAQWEIRQYSHELARILRAKMPQTWAPFESGLEETPGYREMFEALK